MLKYSLMAIGVLLTFACLYCPVFHAMPRFMERYDADPYAKADLRGRCTVCHVSESGFGPLNAFGRAFAENGYRITESLRQQFPDVFTGGGTPSQPAATTGAGSDSEFKAKEFYAANCALCHGQDGRGAGNPIMPVPDFSDITWQKEKGDEELIQVMRNGKGLMPAWKEKLTTEQIKALIGLVRKFAEGR